MSKNESTAINDLIHLVSGRIVDHGSPAADHLFVTAPPPPPAFVPVASYFEPAAISSPMPPPLPRRRAPNATPMSVPQQPIFHDDDDDDEETQFDPHFAQQHTLPSQAFPIPSVASPLPAYPQPILPHYAYPTPAPLPPAPHVPGYDATERVERYEPLPQQAWPVVQPARPVVSRASFDGPETVRVSRLPAPPLDAPPTRGEVWGLAKRLALPFAGIAILVGILAGLIIHKGRGSSTPPDTTPVVMEVSVPVAAPVATVEPIEPVSETPPTVSATGDTIGWKPTAVQPTLAVSPTVEPIAGETEIEMEPARAVKQSRSRRKAARVAAPAKRIAVAATAPKAVRAPNESPKKVAAPVHDEDEIAAAIAAPVKGAKASAKGSGPGTVTITSSPAALIYVDGRSLNQMTPKTLTLSPGAHKITLLEVKSRKAKTQEIDVAPGGSLSVAKRF
ncbi:MAG: hypothetical protein H0T46_28500 [Deltaproteobacteria bacterium]|nr:hypothetical protein [Deltaproteobacteria bacterium]